MSDQTIRPAPIRISTQTREARWELVFCTAFLEIILIIAWILFGQSLEGNLIILAGCVAILLIAKFIGRRGTWRIDPQGILHVSARGSRTFIQWDKVWAVRWADCTLLGPSGEKIKMPNILIARKRLVVFRKTICRRLGMDFGFDDWRAQNKPFFDTTTWIGRLGHWVALILLVGTVPLIAHILFEYGYIADSALRVMVLCGMILPGLFLSIPRLIRNRRYNTRRS